VLDDASGLDGRRQRTVVDSAAGVSPEEQVRHVGRRHQYPSQRNPSRNQRTISTAPRRAVYTRSNRPNWQQCPIIADRLSRLEFARTLSGHFAPFHEHLPLWL